MDRCKQTFTWWLWQYRTCMEMATTTRTYRYLLDQPRGISIFTIWNHHYDTKNKDRIPYFQFFSLTDKLSSFGWIYKASFDLVERGTCDIVAGRFAEDLMLAQSSLYSQHIAGIHEKKTVANKERIIKLYCGNQPFQKERPPPHPNNKKKDRGWTPPGCMRSSIGGVGDL